VTSTALTQSVNDLTKPGGALDLGADRAGLLVAMLRLLAHGQPVEDARIDDAIRQLGIDATTAQAQLRAWTERDQRGRIVGLGLTLNPTPHEVVIDGTRMWTWCAMDTLIFAIVLGKNLAVISTAHRLASSYDSRRARPESPTRKRPRP
jgi:alkylmercury lyase